MCFYYVDETKWHWLLFIRRIIRTLQSKAMTFNTKMRFLFIESMWNIPETEASTFSQQHKHMYDPNQISLQWSVFCFRWQLKVSNYSAIASIIFSIMIISSALVRPEPKPSQAKPNQILIHTNCSFALHLKMIIYFYVLSRSNFRFVFDKCDAGPLIQRISTIVFANSTDKPLLLGKTSKPKCMYRERKRHHC